MASASNSQYQSTSYPSIIPNSCAPCSHDNKEVIGHTYCLDCEEHFCQTCTEYHNKFAGLVGHRLECSNTPKSTQNHTIKQGQTTLLPDPKLADVEKKLEQKMKQHSDEKNPLELRMKNPQNLQGEAYSVTQCRKHGGETVTVYCQDHKDVGCHTCAAISHRNCKTISYLPQASFGFSHSKEMKDYTENIASIMKNLQNIRSARVTDMEMLTQKTSTIIEAIQEYRSKIIRQLDQITFESIKTVKWQNEALKEKIREDIGGCDVMYKEMETLQKEFSKIDPDNDIETFVHATKGNHVITKGEQISKITSEAIGKEYIRYQIGASLDDFLTRMKVFGTIKITSNSPVLDNIKVLKYKMSVFQEKTIWEHANRSLTISACCAVPEDFLAFIVRKQYRDVLMVQNLVNQQCTVHLLNGKAFGICSTGPKEVALTMRNGQANGKVQFVNLKSGLKSYFTDPFRRVLTVNHPVYGIACHGDTLYLGGQHSVMAYNKEGLFLHKIHKHCQPKDIAVSRDGNLLYIADPFAGVVIVNKFGEIQNTLKDKYLAGSCGVSVDDDGNVFAVGSQSSSVVHFDNQGIRKGVFIASSVQYSMPMSLCYVKTNKMILVTGTLNNDQF